MNRAIVTYAAGAHEELQRRHDVVVYDAIHAGERPPTWNEFSQPK